MKLEDLNDEDRELVVVALQALHRERLTASNSAFTFCQLAGKTPPPDDIFGLYETRDALRRIGAAPAR
ncbi:hypothetical protein [Leclercia sp. UBA7405]|uniref:hypothetical protein n=1 Tax=Leclercia sp. UBA7405 TaxID=1946743 RepID=UPI0030171072